MRINKHVTLPFLFLLFFLLAVMLPGNVEIDPPANALKPPEPLDKVSNRELDYFLKIPPYIDRINHLNFFKPYEETATQRISLLLGKAAELEPEECYKQYLSSLAFNVLQGNFQTDTPEWYTLENNKVEIIFLPDNTHRMQELWLRLFFQYSPLDWKGYDWEKWYPFASNTPVTPAAPTQAETHKIFDTFIFINDTEETRKYEGYIDIFDKMQDHVPQGKDKAVPFTSLVPRLKIAHLVYSSSPGQVSIVFPDRDVFNRDGRFKILIFKNLIDAYVQCILKPIAGKIWENNPFQPVVIDSDSYLSNLVMYKMAHHMGPMFAMMPKKTDQDIKKEMELRKRQRTIQDPDMQQILEREQARQKEEAIKEMEEKRDAAKEIELKLIVDVIGPWFAISKDLKAGVISIHNTSTLIENGLLPQKVADNIYATYIVTLLDKIRKDPSGRGSLGSIIQFNYLLRNEAIRFNIGTKRISLQSYLFAGVIEKLAQLVIDKYKSPQLLYGEYGLMSPELQALLDNIKEIPVDINIDINKASENLTDPAKK